MRVRKKMLGNRNLIGARVSEARRIRKMKQVTLLEHLNCNGIEITASALSLLEGQQRPVSDIELSALSSILQVSVEWLFGKE